ncbi:MAG: pyruvate formate lyase-activating protein [Lachnospiraceae bacterium]|nr:pyruvate formate lyase-activating protein [Lachnospiraceae bacterium]
MYGNIHSIETFGTVDGPGVRYVVFFQGCPMRCQYCHNPDTWDPSLGDKMDVNTILSDYQRYKPFLRGGGITITGGEPLLQIDFLIELFEEAKKRDIHTCLDTSGIIFNKDNPAVMSKFDRLIKVTDLVMLDIKHIDDEGHKKLVGHSNKNILDFAKYLDENNIPMWIRHVVVPGITDDPDELTNLGRFIGTLKNVQALDALPYHVMGKAKYESLGIEYPLGNTPALSKAKLAEAKELILKGIREVKN